MITITETLYKKMPDDIKACFNQLPNPSSEEVRECFPETGSPRKARTAVKGGCGGALGKFGGSSPDAIGNWPEDNGGNASRFFKSIIYTAKASKSDRGEGNFHPTVKAVALMEYLINMITRQGCVVLDPFCGSGSTGVAALQMGRNFIGIELNPDYVELSRRRVGQAMPLFAEAKP